MDAFLFVAILVGVIFAVDAVSRWWRLNAWRRRDDDDDAPVNRVRDP